MKITKRMKFKKVDGFYPDMNGLVSNDANFERKVIGTKALTPNATGYEATLSVQEVDRDGDVIITSGIDISYYAGTLIWNHCLDALPIGHCLDYKEKDGVSTGTLTFAKDYDFAEDVENLVKQGMLKGISIGYIPKVVVIRGTRAFTEAANKWGITDPNCGRILLEVELIEVSVVTIGANKMAMISAIATKSFVPSDTATQLLGLDDEYVQTIIALEERIAALEGNKTVEPVVENLPIVETPLIVEPIVENPLPSDLPIIDTKPTEDKTTDEPVVETPPIVEPVVETPPIVVVISKPPVKSLAFTVIRKGGCKPNDEEVKTLANSLASGKLV